MSPAASPGRLRPPYGGLVIPGWSGGELALTPGEGLPGREELVDALEGQWLGEVEPLAEVAAQGQELLELVGALDPLGHRPQAQDPGELDDGRREGRLLAALVHAVHER